MEINLENPPFGTSWSDVCCVRNTAREKIMSSIDNGITIKKQDVDNWNIAQPWMVAWNEKIRGGKIIVDNSEYDRRP